MSMNFDFKKNEDFLEKKSITPKVSKFTQFSKFKNYFSGGGLNISINRIPAAFWSITGLILAVLAMNFKVENAVWAIPVSCILYYSGNKIVPFFVMLIALVGMAIGIPQLAFLMIFSIITMIKWSEI